MLKKILSYGAVSGLIVGGVLFVVSVSGDLMHGAAGMLVGYLTMLVGLSLVFLAIKRHRDASLGGVIRFWPAFGLGLGISFVASLIYVLSWEAAMAVTGMDFATTYGTAVIEQKRAAGASAETLAKLGAEMERFKTMYADPLYRMPMTFTEIFPVGAIVSLISAALLRNSRLWPARRT